MRRVDVTGQRFGRLTATQRSARGGRSYWLCDCDCGNQTSVALNKLKTGHTQSCGCLHREFLDKWERNSTHKHTGHYLHRCWGAMKNRCNNPNNECYMRYGGRGISYSPLFEHYEDFRDYILTNLGERPQGHSIDRIDNNGNYAPGNLRWANPSQQSANRECCK